MEFVNVVFDCDNEYIKIIFEGSNEFTNCTFNCDCTTFLKPYGAIIFRKCDLQGFKMIEFNDIIQNKEKTEGTKVSSEMNVCDTEFSSGLDFQGSIFEWKILFKNSVCKSAFYFWETKFFKKDRVDFYEFYIEEFIMLLII